MWDGVGGRVAERPSEICYECHCMVLRRGGGGGFAPQLCAFGFAVLVVACGGSTEAEQQSPVPGGGSTGLTAGAGNATGGSSVGGAGGSVSSVEVPSDCTVSPGSVVLQRLTRSEYDRTVRDLFGVTSGPAQVFPPDSATDGFDNNAQSLTISPQLTELLLDAAEIVANEAIVNKHDEIFFCEPEPPVSGNVTCIRDILNALALRVQRRPATSEEIDAMMDLLDVSNAEGDSFETGVGFVLQALLMSPQFLYRGIPAAGTLPPEAGSVEALDDYALASRLSYFLWGSTPDDALLQSAADGALRDATVLRSEFDRLLTDQKATALFDGFISQWFALGKLQSANPDPAVFPQFTEELRQSMADEVRTFFEDLRSRDGSVLELINGTNTFANADLASVYGIAGVTGSTLQAVTTDPMQRAGILTMPAILTMTSGPTEPNIVRRGVWLAENILCAKPPPPPDGVPPAPDAMPGETERQRLARHRSNPACSSCHDLIDPLGFAFESYDAIGAFRDTAQGVPVDNQGTLPDGRSFAGVVELAGLLQEGDEYSSCATRKLMMYALGRSLQVQEQCLVSAIGSQTVTPSSHLSDWLWAIATSDAFQMREAPEAP